MTSQSILISLVQAALCFAIVILLRVAVVYLGARLGGILTGTPMLVFPLLVMQAWLGPLPDQNQMLGSITSITSITLGLWSMKLPFNFTAWSAVLTMAAVWSAILTTLYLTKVPAAVMATAILANATFILTRYANHRPTVRARRAKLTEGAIPTVIFLLTFFLTKEVVPDFVRGVLAMFPVALLATLFFVRRTTDLDGFRHFVTYTHGAVTATAIFVIAMYFTIVQMSVPLSLAVSLLISICASVVVSRIWKPVPALEARTGM